MKNSSSLSINTTQETTEPKTSHTLQAATGKGSAPTSCRGSRRKYKKISSTSTTSVGNVAIRYGLDVICGKGERVKRKNSHYHAKIRKYYRAYQAPYVTNQRKREIAEGIYNQITFRGGRFFSSQGDILTKKRAVEKIMKSLKDAKELRAEEHVESIEQVQGIDGREEGLGSDSTDAPHSTTCFSGDLSATPVTPPTRPKPVRHRVVTPLSNTFPSERDTIEQRSSLVDRLEDALDKGAFVDFVEWLADGNHMDFELDEEDVFGMTSNVESFSDGNRMDSEPPDEDVFGMTFEQFMNSEVNL